MKISKGTLLVAACATILAACGGGGGSSGESHSPYVMSLNAEKMQLPVNDLGAGPGIGAGAPFTTTVYVEATEDGRPIPGGDNVFSCNIVNGLSSGYLYYLDGAAEHEDEDGNPKAYRNITLGSNTGGASFHLHAGNQDGVVTIRCSVTDPRDKKQVDASIDIKVG